MDNLLLRTAALLVHALLNFIIISWLTDFDITGRWITLIGFILLVLLLLALFIRHIISFIIFIKSKP